MKKLWYMVLTVALSCMTGCSSGGDEMPEQKPPVENTPSEEQKPSKEEEIKKEIEGLKKDLCFGGKFVERVFKDFSAHNNSFKAVTKQKDYHFYKEGKGTVMTYVLTTDTDKGFTFSEEDFTWSVSSTVPLSLKITVEGTESFAMEEVSVTDSTLSSKNTDWNKELVLADDLKVEDIESYSVEHLHGWVEKRNGEPYVYITPTILTVKTKDGVMRFIRNRRGYDTLGFAQGYYRNTTTGESGYFDENIYFRTPSDAPIFYWVELNKDELDFKTNDYKSTQYNFPVGYVSEEQVLTLMDNKKEYEID